MPLVLQLDGREVANVIVHSVGLGSLSSTRRYQVQELVKEKKKQDAARQTEPGVHGNSKTHKRPKDQRRANLTK